MGSAALPCITGLPRTLITEGFVCRIQRVCFPLGVGVYLPFISWRSYKRDIETRKATGPLHYRVWCPHWDHVAVGSSQPCSFPSTPSGARRGDASGHSCHEVLGSRWPSGEGQPRSLPCPADRVCRAVSVPVHRLAHVPCCGKAKPPHSQNTEKLSDFSQLFKTVTAVARRWHLACRAQARAEK